MRRRTPDEAWGGGRELTGSNLRRDRAQPSRAFRLRYPQAEGRADSTRRFVQKSSSQVRDFSSLSHLAKYGWYEYD